MKRFRAVIFASCLLVFFNAIATAQCAMCRGAVESTVAAGDTSMASNLNFGIMYLFVAPYLLFAVLGYFWYRTSKKNGKKIKAFGHTIG
jgi:RsiW-degrading membrane proteinase PrsW (M82 family)